jgi:hypothetical protein
MGTLREERARAEAERRRLLVRIGVAVVVLLAGVAGVGLLAGGRPVAPGQGRYEPGSADPVTAALPALAGAVEGARGLRFRSPPSVAVLDPKAFAAEVARPLPTDGPAPNRLATARALSLAHLAPPHLAPPHLAPRRPAADLAAFYSYRRHQVLLRSDIPFDAFGRVVLVHELTHALDDQTFDLLALSRAAAGDADRLRALDALIEGDATRVELSYVDTQPAADQAAVKAAYDYDPPLRTYADNERYFPYTAGRDFVAAVVRTGGGKAVDEAFRHPPESTAQIIDPARYTAHQAPLGVRAPAVAGARVDGGTLGQFGLAMLVSGGHRLANVSGASQWAGDAYVTVRSGRGYCTYVNLVLATTTAREQVYGDLLPYVRNPANRARLAKSTDRGVRLSACT